MKVLFMCLDAILYDDLPKGLIMIFDMKGVGLMHLARVNLVAVRKFFYYLQEALPIQLKAIHVLNTVSFLDRILKIIRPFMKQEIFELVIMIVLRVHYSLKLRFLPTNDTVFPMEKNYAKI